MVFPVFGTVGDLGKFGLQAVQTLVEVCLGPSISIAKNSLTEVRDTWTTVQDLHPILYSELPDAALSDRFLNSETPYCVMLDLPHVVAAGIRSHPGFDDLGAARLSSETFASLHDLALGPKAFIVRGDWHDVLVRDLLAHMAQHLLIPLTRAHLTTLMEKLTPQGKAATSLRLGDILVNESSSQQRPAREDFGRLAAAALDGYNSLFERRPATRFDWPSALFQKSADPSDTMLSRLDLLGPARLLFFGPYLNLPRGSWVASPMFTLIENWKGLRGRFDVHTDHVAAVQECILPESGTYACDLAFEVDSTRVGNQVRLFSEEGSIEGHLDFAGVTVTRREVPKH